MVISLHRVYIVDIVLVQSHKFIPNMHFLLACLFVEKNLVLVEGVMMNHYIADSARLGKEIKVGGNTIIMDDAVIGNYCQIGNNVVIHPGTYIGDNVRIDDNTVIGKTTYFTS